MGEPFLRVTAQTQDHDASRRRPVQTLRVKMVLLGSSGVGKSSLALRFGKDQFRSTSPTVGCAYLTRMVHLSDVSLRFEIWDTAGQETYHSVTPLYYRGAHTALLVYDISRRETFVRAQLWLKELEKQYIPGSTVIWLIGNKGDLSEDRQVTEQEGQILADERNLFFTETSALSGDQVTELLLMIGSTSTWERSREGCLSGEAHHVWTCTRTTTSSLLTPAVKCEHCINQTLSVRCVCVCVRFLIPNGQEILNNCKNIQVVASKSKV